jgi:hypothetical protein
MTQGFGLTNKNRGNFPDCRIAERDFGTRVTEWQKNRGILNLPGVSHCHGIQ